MTRFNHTSNSLGSRTANAFVWLAATKAVGQAMTWGLTIVVVRLLAPQDYGLMGMAVLATGLLLLFNEFGLGSAMVQDADLNAREVSDLRWAIFGINLTMFLFLLAVAPLIGAYFREPGLTAIVRVLATAFVINGIGAASMYLLQREMAFKLKSQAEFIGSVGGAFVTLAGAVAGLGVWSLVIGYLVQQVVTNVLYCVYHPLPIHLTFSFNNIRRFLSFGIQIAFARLLWYVSSNADSIVIGRVLGTAALGFYSLAFQFASVPIDKVSSVVVQVALPAFSSVQDDNETLRRHYLTLVAAIAFITFPMFLGLFLIADNVVAALLTSKWVAIVLPLKVLCIVSCSRSIETMNAPLIMAKGKARIIVLNNLLQAIVMPMAFYVGTGYGLKGVSIAWLVTWPILAAIMTWQTLRLIDLSWSAYLGALKHVVAASTLMVVVVLVVQQRVIGDASAAFNMALTCVLGVALYGSYHAMFNMEAVREAIRIVRGGIRKTPAIANVQLASDVGV